MTAFYSSLLMTQSQLDLMHFDFTAATIYFLFDEVSVVMMMQTDILDSFRIK